MKKLFTLFAAALFATNMSAQIVYVSAIQNGDLEGDDVTNFYSKEAQSDPYPSIIEDGIGVNGSRGIKVTSTAGAEQDWDTQFWIAFTDPIPAGSKLRGSFDMKASIAATADTQAHGNPSNYSHWACIGSPNFTEDWTTYEFEVTVGSEWCQKEEGFLSIAFNLSKDRENDVEYYFDNFVVEKGVVPDPVWVNILPNGNCEGDVESGIVEADGEFGTLYSFLCRQPGADEDAPFIVDGVGVDGTRAAMLTSSPDAEQDWDTQFFITTAHKFEVDERVRLVFDCRADVEDLGLESVTIGTQAHANPGNYIHWACAGNVTFTQDWQTFESQFIVSSDMTKPDDDKYMQSIAFNLNPQIDGARQEINYYIDNIKLYIDEPNATWDDQEMAEKVAEQWRGGDATGVKTLKTQKANSVITNLAGQRVDKNYKGIVIENGQKRINK
jgi:hypothetical protein